MRAESVPQEDTDMVVGAALQRALERALALRGRAVYRLGAAGTSVTFAIDDDPGGGVTILLDRHPPAVRPRAEPSELTVGLSREQALAFIRGELVLPNEIATGAVSAWGAARRYLRVDPVLRALLARVWHDQSQDQRLEDVSHDR
jgi:hypothetical protein